MAIRPEQLGEAIERELTLYSKEITQNIKVKSKKAISQLVKKTKATAPVGKRYKHYRDSITSKKLREDANGAAYLWYVKDPDYRLSHLLNNGHQLRDGGRYQGTQFITHAHDKIVEEYLQEVEDIIRNGS